MLEEEVQIEILDELVLEVSFGFRRAAWTRAGATAPSACAACLAVVRSAAMACSTRTLTRARIVVVCAQSCKFLNSQIELVKLTCEFIKGSTNLVLPFIIQFTYCNIVNILSVKI